MKKKTNEIIMHSCEHVLAAAVCRLFPETQLAAGAKHHTDSFFYDFCLKKKLTLSDLKIIEKEMLDVIKNQDTFKKTIIAKKEAIELFKNLNQQYKIKILDKINDENVTIYKSGNFIDLCRGPHIKNTGEIGAFFLTEISGSYWGGDSSKEMLQRIKGVAFSSEKEMRLYVSKKEEAKKRDHRKIGKDLDMFAVSEKFNSLSYDDKNNATIAFFGKINSDLDDLGLLSIQSIVSESIIPGIKKCIKDKKIKLDSFFIKNESLGDVAFEIEAEILVSALPDDVKLKLAELNNGLSNKHKNGKIRIKIKTKLAEDIGPGLVLWLPNGSIIRNEIENFSKKLHTKNGYKLVYSPHIAKSDLWRISGHSDFYKENMFPSLRTGGSDYTLKPMNCPFHILMYKHSQRSYRDLPIRFAELGTVYRNELTGVAHGLMRARGFTVDDAHIFCRWDQVAEEIDSVLALTIKTLKAFDFKDFSIKLSTRPQKFVGTDENWKMAEAALIESIKRNKMSYEIDAEGGAFYGPKIDIALKDSLDRSWQCSTVQLDFNNAKQFGLFFKNSQGQNEETVMIHRALFGSIERFIGILIEEFNGSMPTWLSPEQVKIIPIASHHLAHAKKIEDILLENNIRASIFSENEKLGSKVRKSQVKKIPIMLIIGDDEEKQNGACVRLRSGENLGFMSEKDLALYCAEKARAPGI